MIYGLSVTLFGRATTLPDFPRRKDLRGVGLSDPRFYASELRRKFDYTNTHFHKRPKLDIASAGSTKFSGLDFIVASDVFEHVAPPIDVAFTNARRLLREGGFLIFSVPYVPAGRTEEHFPDLYDYALGKDGNRRVLVNRTRTGALQRYDRLVFHGGAGATLEMRLFSFEDLKRQFRAAGFESPQVLNVHIPRFGIDWRGQHCSIPMIARAGSPPEDDNFQIPS